MYTQTTVPNKVYKAVLVFALDIANRNILIQRVTKSHIERVREEYVTLSVTRKIIAKCM